MPLFRRAKPPVDVAPVRRLWTDGIAAWQAGRVAEAEAALAAAVAQAEAAGTAADDLRRAALVGLSRVFLHDRRFGQAQAALDAATEIIAHHGWQGSERHLAVLVNVALLRWEQGRRDEALRVLEHAHATAAPRVGSAIDHHALAAILDNLVGYHTETGDAPAAQRWLAVATAHCDARGAELLAARASLIKRRQRLWAITGKTPAGLDDLRHHAADFERLAGADHRSCGQVIATVGTALLQAGRFDDAADQLRRALKVQRPHAGRSAQDGVGMTVSNLGMVELSRGRFAEAEACFREAVDLAERRGGGAEPRMVPIWLNNLGVALREMGQLDEAEQALRRAITAADAAYGPNHFHPANAVKNLGQTCQRSGRPAEAAALFEQALARFAAAAPTAEPVAERVAETRELLRAVRAGNGRP